MDEDSKPLLAGDNGRDVRGRFTAGNREARGNPHARRVGELRSAMLDAVTANDLAEIVQAMITKAKSGDVVAAREILDRCLGKPKHDANLAVVAQFDEPTVIVLPDNGRDAAVDGQRRCSLRKASASSGTLRETTQ